jgi:hypothetical protein
VAFRFRIRSLRLKPKAWHAHRWLAVAGPGWLALRVVSFQLFLVRDLINHENNLQESIGAAGTAVTGI